MPTEAGQPLLPPVAEAVVSSANFPIPTLPLKAALALSLVAGALSVLAFAPFGLWPLQVLCLALLYWMVLGVARVPHAAWLGTAYGTAAMAAGVHWLYISLHDIGGMPAWLTVLAIVLLAFGLGLLTGLATGGARWLQQRWRCNPTVTLLLLLPSLCMLADWTRSWIFTGFPWLAFGYAHTGAPLAGFAPLIGIYGVSWIACLIAAALVVMALHLRHTPIGHGRRPSAIAAGAIAVLLIGGQLLRAIDWTRPHGKPVTVRLLQGNVAQEMKFDRATLGDTLGLYQAMLTQAPADLIATSETALPVPQQLLPPGYLQQLATYATTSGSHLLLGMPITDSPTQYANGLIVLAPEPAAPTTFPVPIAEVPKVYRYDKHHLVPFGEFIPPGFRWFVDMMQMPLGDQNRGALLQPPFALKDQWVLPNICYEDLFGEEIAAQIRNRAGQSLPAPTILLNISNIAWFGDSIALPQHLQISQMRTLETGRPMLRATNTGATAVIGPHAQVQAQLAPFIRGTLAATVQGYEGLTPFIVLGNGAVVAIGLLSLAAAGWLARRKRSA